MQQLRVILISWRFRKCCAVVRLKWAIGLHLPPGMWHPGHCQGNAEETEKILYPKRSRLWIILNNRGGCVAKVCVGEQFVRWWCCTVTFDQGSKKTGSPINIFSAQLRCQTKIAQIPHTLKTLKSRLTTGQFLHRTWRYYLIAFHFIFKVKSSLQQKPMSLHVL